MGRYCCASLLASLTRSTVVFRLRDGLLATQRSRWTRASKAWQCGAPALDSHPFRRYACDPNPELTLPRSSFRAEVAVRPERAAGAAAADGQAHLTRRRDDPVTRTDLPAAEMTLARERLRRLVALRSVAADARGVTDTAAAVAELLAEDGFEPELHETGGAPVVFAQRLVPARPHCSSTTTTTPSRRVPWTRGHRRHSN